MAEAAFKNVYVIDMNKVLSNRVTWTVLGAALPISLKNGIVPSGESFMKQLSERCVKKMIKQYDILSTALGETEASTVIEYLDKSGAPVVTLYPTNDIIVHNNDWTNLAPTAIEDLYKIHDERVMALNKLKQNIKGK